MKANIQKNNKSHFKRREASIDGCKHDLKKELSLLFKAFNEAYSAYEKEIIQTPPEARARCFEASLLNSKMIQSIQNNFPLNWKFGKYKRFTLRVNGYVILFKKLDKNDKPMNIKTNAVTAISQQLTIPLFDDSTYVAEPILFFGYKKDKIGNIHDPKLIYLDEDKVRWMITEDDVDVTLPTILPKTEETEAVPVLRPALKKKKASNG